jgi:hypothetical protein
LAVFSMRCVCLLLMLLLLLPPRCLALASLGILWSSTEGRCHQGTLNDKAACARIASPQGRGSERERE